jgi:hypothetical protein
MTDRKKIIELAKKFGAVHGVLHMGRCDNTVFTTGEIEAFHHAVRNEAFEQAALVCDGWPDAPGWQCAEGIRELKGK